MWFGYLRAERFFSRADCDHTRRAIYDYAAHLGLGSGGVFIEPRPSAQVLWDLLHEADRHGSTSGILAYLDHRAAARDLHLDQLVDSPNTEMLWQTLQAIKGAGGGHLVVPSRAHLTNLGASGREFTDQITHMRHTSVHYLAADAGVHDGSTRVTDDDTDGTRTDTDEWILVEVQATENTPALRLEVVSELVRQDWPQTIDAVDQVCMRLLADAAVITCAGDGTTVVPQNCDVTLRLIHSTGDLVVELEETRRRLDALPSTLVELCAHVQRHTSNDRTITRCTLAPQPTAATHAVSPEALP